MPNVPSAKAQLSNGQRVSTQWGRKRSHNPLEPALRQRVFTRSDFGLAENTTGHEDTVLDPNDPIFQIAQGHEAPKRDYSQLQAWQKDNPQNNKARYMKEHNIKPGTPAWFALWFGK